MSLEKECKFCGKRFKPKRDWQKFCKREHQRDFWKQIYAGRAALDKRIEKLEEQINK